MADRLKIDPKALPLRVGEGARIGAEVAVFRGDMDVSSMCYVTSLMPGCRLLRPGNQDAGGRFAGGG